MQIMLKGGNKLARIICDTSSKLSIWAPKRHRIFSLWATFNNFRVVLIANFLINIQPRKIFLFYYIIFVFQNIISGSEHKCTSEHLRRNKQKMNARKKTIEEKQTIIFYFVMWDIQSHSTMWRSGNDLESGYL